MLVVEELASNAVRHGRPPVLVEVVAVDGGWLVEVSDAAVRVPPALASDRDPARGGLAMYLIARLCTAYGWTIGDDVKTVWARWTTG